MLIDFFGENGHSYKLIISLGKKVLVSPNLFLIFVGERNAFDLYCTKMVINFSSTFLLVFVPMTTWLLYKAETVWYPSSMQLYDRKTFGKISYWLSLLYFNKKTFKSFNYNFKFCLKYEKKVIKLDRFFR